MQFFTTIKTSVRKEAINLMRTTRVLDSSGLLKSPIRCRVLRKTTLCATKVFKLRNKKKNSTFYLFSVLTSKPKQNTQSRKNTMNQGWTSLHPLKKNLLVVYRTPWPAKTKLLTVLAKLLPHWRRLCSLVWRTVTNQETCISTKLKLVAVASRVEISLLTKAMYSNQHQVCSKEANNALAN